MKVLNELTIGKLAEESGVNLETVRYYERQGAGIVGFLVHFGLSIQKGLILVEYINQLRGKGMDFAKRCIVARTHVYVRC
ncbi:MAG: MerR family DNA-binding transcriptional regulator [Acidobacteriota bacterium]